MQALNFDSQVMCNVVVLVLLVLISWKEASCSTVIPINEQPKCQQHVLTQCSGLNYSTALRNFRGQSNPTDIENEFLQFEILFRYNCSNALLVLLCSVYAPICISDHDGKSVILKPCRNLCEHVYDGCTLIFQEFNYPWPVFLECSKFPSRNDSDEPCFGPPDPMTIPYPDLVSPNSTIPCELMQYNYVCIYMKICLAELLYAHNDWACKNRACGHIMFAYITFQISITHNFLYHHAIAMQFSSLSKHLIGFMIQVPILRYNLLCDGV